MFIWPRCSCHCRRRRCRSDKRPVEDGACFAGWGASKGCKETDEANLVAANDDPAADVAVVVAAATAAAVVDDNGDDVNENNNLKNDGGGDSEVRVQVPVDSDDENSVGDGR